VVGAGAAVPAVEGWAAVGSGVGVAAELQANTSSRVRRAILEKTTWKLVKCRLMDYSSSNQSNTVVGPKLTRQSISGLSSSTGITD
jgi:hypothetical protein